jgi:hypothetical protein
VGKVLKLESKRQSDAPGSRVQSTRRRPAEPSPLTAELKDFIDRVIVPILVKDYLAVSDPESQLAKNDSDAAHFAKATRLHRS